MYDVMHMIGGSQQIKFGETYAKSIKTGQFDLGKQIIQFCQQNHKSRNIWFLKSEHPVLQTQHIDKETYTNDFKAFTYTYLHKQDMKRMGYNEST
jgi:hypothetical protein